MKAKILIIASIAMLFMACETNSPEELQNQTSSETTTTTEETKQEETPEPLTAEQLVGVWNESQGKNGIRSLLFIENGMLLYRQYENGLEKTLANLQYKVEEEKLIVSSDPSATNPWSDTLSVVIKDSVMTIDNFKYTKKDVPFSFIAKKAEDITQAKSNSYLDKIFNKSNLLLYQSQYSPTGWAYVFSNLSNISNISGVPNYDSQTQCIVSTDRTDYTKEGMRVALFRNQEINLFEFVLMTHKSSNGETVYPYGVFNIAASELSSIKRFTYIVTY